MANKSFYISESNWARLKDESSMSGAVNEALAVRYGQVKELPLAPDAVTSVPELTREPVEQYSYQAPVTFDLSKVGAKRG